MSTALARAGFVVLVLGVVTAAAAVAQDGPPVLTVDHYVMHVSTAPAMDGQPVRLYVRERVLDQGPADLPGAGGVVLFVHGSIFPSTPSFDLPLADYSWMAYLAEAGFDAFGYGHDGYGRSTRPTQLDDPCNATQGIQQQYLLPNPLKQPCPPCGAAKPQRR